MAGRRARGRVPGARDSDGGSADVRLRAGAQPRSRAGSAASTPPRPAGSAARRASRRCASPPRRCRQGREIDAAVGGRAAGRAAVRASARSSARAACTRPGLFSADGDAGRAARGRRPPQRRRQGDRPCRDGRPAARCTSTCCWSPAALPSRSPRRRWWRACPCWRRCRRRRASPSARARVRHDAGRLPARRGLQRVFAGASASPASSRPARTLVHLLTLPRDPGLPTAFPGRENTLGSGGTRDPTRSVIVWRSRRRLALAVPTRGAAPVSTDYSEQVVASGLTAPTAIAFLPDRRLLVTEKGGALKLVQGGTATTLTTIPVCTASEMGLLGIAADPELRRQRLRLPVPHQARRRAAAAPPPGASTRSCACTMSGNTVVPGQPHGAAHRHPHRQRQPRRRHAAHRARRQAVGLGRRHRARRRRRARPVHQPVLAGPGTRSRARSCGSSSTASPRGRQPVHRPAAARGRRSTRAASATRSG